MVRLLLIMACLGASMGLHAQTLGDKRVRGAVFYKKHAFLPDTNVQIYEYTYVRSAGRTQFFTTLNGPSIKVTPDNDVIYIPYPARGEADITEASASIAMAQKRFPQYTLFLKRVDKAWQIEGQRPSELLASEQGEARQRRSILDRFFDMILQREQHQGEKLPSQPSALSASSLDQKSSAEPTPVSASTESGAAANDSTDLERNLNRIQQYYQKAQDVEK